MFLANPAMLKKGYAPASRVAEALGKSLMTMHRWAKEEKFKFSRDGRALYINLDSLIASYERGHPSLEELRKLKEEISKQAKEGARTT